jgi:hypothetical protein
MMKVKLLTDVQHPALWVFNGPKYSAGTVVPVIPANNQPGEGKFWIDTPELQDDCYGILLEPGEYEIVN